jgi:hypothetical protein
MMHRTKTLLATAATIVAAHVVMRLLGFASHTSILAGMPQSDASFVIGPLYVLLHLSAVIVAPIIALAAAIDAALAGAGPFGRRGRPPG